MLHKKNILIAQ